MSVTLRPLRIDDAPVVADLARQLGYPSDVADVARRLDEVIGREDHAAWAAEVEGEVVGWIHALRAVRVESDPFVEIGGLVVGVAHRGSGIGGRLVGQVEAWTRDLGISLLRVRTRTTREDAPRFYARHGFRETKQQRVLDKELS
jgi:GNAT superfamily N-acetyltransferase